MQAQSFLASRTDTESGGGDGDFFDVNRVSIQIHMNIFFRNGSIDYLFDKVI